MPYKKLNLFVLRKKQYKSIKKAGKITLYILAIIIGLLLLAYALFRSVSFQNWATHKIADYLSKELKTVVRVEGIDIDPIKTLVIEGLYVEDLKKDTLFYFKQLKVDINDLNFKKSIFHLNKIIIEDAYTALRSDGKTGIMNLQFLLDYFASTSTDTASSPFELKVDELIIKKSTFIYRDESAPAGGQGMNYWDLDIRKISLEASSVVINGTSIQTQLKHLELHEKCGFKISNFEGNIVLNPHEIRVSQFTLETPFSKIGRFYSMKFNEWNDFTEFNTKIRLFARFENTKASFTDIAFFAPALSGNALSTKITGDIGGTVSDLQAKELYLRAGVQTQLKTNFNIKGLPDIDKTRMNVQVSNLITNKKDIDYIVQRIINIPGKVICPDFVNEFGKLGFSGTFKGYYNNFHTTGVFTTSIGSARADMKMKFPDGKVPSYSGTLQLSNLQLGKLINKNPDEVGNVSLTSTITGRGFNVKELYNKIDAKIESISLNNYTYNNININGLFDKKLFSGGVKINDDNVRLDFKGSIDFNKALPFYNFEADLSNVNLRKLNLWSDSGILKTHAEIYVSGNSLDNLKGDILISELSYTKPQQVYKLNALSLKANDSKGIKSLVLISDVADASIIGQYNLSTLLSSFKKLSMKYIPSRKFNYATELREQNFNFALKLKNTQQITALFIPGLVLPDTGSFRGNFNSSSNKVRFSGELSYIRYKEYLVKRVNVDAENDANAIALNISADEFILQDSVSLNTINISNIVSNNQVNFNVKLANKSSANQLDLNGQLAISSDSVRLSILPSELLIDNQEWKVLDQFSILFEKNRAIINRFSLKNKFQEISIHGAISASDDDALYINLKNIDLASFNQLTKNYNVILGGNITGSAEISSVLKNKKIISGIVINDLTYNGNKLGSAAFGSGWDQLSQLINFTGTLKRDGVTTIATKGTLSTNPAKIDNSLIATIDLAETNLIIVQPFIQQIISGLKGTTTANLDVSGSLKKPKISGSLSLNNTSLKINYLQNSININATLPVENSVVKLNNVKLTDAEGNEATLNGSINLKNPQDPYFDATINTRKFICLNTGPKDNSLYYGRAKASGRFSFKGKINDMVINIAARTEKGTQFFIPLKEENAVSQSSFINFVKKDTLKLKHKDAIDLSGLSLNFDLDVTEDAEVQLIFDEKIGDIIKGRGNANLQLAINTLGDFVMYGEYVIAEGEYLFTLQNLINKRFTVQKGGVIRWSGSPYDATIKLNAIYKQRASNLELYQAAQYKGAIEDTIRIPVECVLMMRNSLIAPDISFALNFPENPSINNQLSGYLRNQDNVNNEVLSLLVFQRFSGAGSLNAGTGVVTGLELLSNQFSNMTSGLIYEGLDLKIGSKNVGGSLRLNDRISIDGNVSNNNANSTILDNGNPNQNTTKESQLVGDISIEYKLSKNGNLRVKAFNKSANTDFISTKNQNVQGLGLLYRAEFDTFGELWRKIINQPADKKASESDTLKR